MLPHPSDPMFKDIFGYVERLYKPKLSSPTPDPTTEAQISNMVNEGGQDKPSSDLDNTIQTALETFERLNKGGEAPSVVVETDGNHSSARWVNKKK
jgi:hypothetical protein